MALALGGCSIKPQPNDPYMPFNMSVQTFNYVVDRSFINPTASFYHNITPYPYRVGVNNFFQNIYGFNILLNDILQLEPKKIKNSLVRLVVNTTLGIGGIFDIASELGFSQDANDLGKTFWVYGWKKSDYIVLPILGPNTVRDGFGQVISMFLNPSYLMLNRKNFVLFQGLALLNRRSELKSLEKVVGYAGVDQYAFMRDAYLQNRNFVLSGNNSAANNSLDGPPE